MLVLTLYPFATKQGDYVEIRTPTGEIVVVKVIEILDGQRVRLAFSAADDVRILRGKAISKMHEEGESQ